MQLYGHEWTRRELEARVGRLEQVGGIRRFQLTEGKEAGVEQIQVRTGAGLCYYVSPSRGLDISLAEFCGTPISWQSANGDVHPAFFDDKGLAWLRTAAGGLLMTCGLTQAGAPSIDGDQHLGLHGRAHHIPARQVAAEGRWSGDTYEMRVAGIVEESVIFGENVRLTREISSRLGSNHIEITDVVENLAFTPAPLMLLYHFNFGFPLLTEDTILSFPSRKVRARDPWSPVEGYDRWARPEPGHRERVYLHEELEQENGWATATVYNPHFPSGAGAHPVTLRLSWATENLPRLVEWRMAGAGEHVLGIEPTNCSVLGRSAARQDGSLVLLAPGETKTFAMRVEITAG